MRKSWLDILLGRLSGIGAGKPAGGLCGCREGRGAAAPRSSGKVRPVSSHHAGISNLLRWAGVALVGVLFLTAPSPAFSLNQGDRIVNNVQLLSSGPSLLSTSVTVTAVLPAPPKIELLTYAPQASGAEKVNVAPGAYRTGSDPGASIVSMPLPEPAGSAPIDLSNPVPLVPASLFHGGEPIFVRVTATDQNLDPTVADIIWVTITDSVTGDKEVVRLTETGPNTGVFAGYIQSNIQDTNSTSSSYDGKITVTSGSNIIATFTDNVYGASTTSSAVVDPFGIVFNSLTGKPIDGAVITLIDVATGQPATVLGDDGVSKFPSAVTSGTSPTDASGRRYDLTPGQFRFPFVGPGTYRLQVTPPAGFAATSTVPFATLQALPGGPFTLLDPGSLGGPFVINPGPAMHLDIPLDPLNTALWLQKSAGADTVAVGDFLPYELDLQNNDAAAAALSVTITDTLPLGFRYRKGSTKLNGLVAPDPAISADGRTLVFTVGDVPPKTMLSVRYVVEVAAGARMGIATNQAAARSLNGSSNLAAASVQVRSDFLNSRSVVMGQVIAGACGAPDSAMLAGVAGVRIYLEDGTFVDTDRRGMFHFEGVKPGSHVVQLDLDSLPEGYRVVPCEENSRFAGTAYSQFVDVQGGSLWRADFHVARKATADEAKEPPAAPKAEAPPLKAASIELHSVLEGNVVEYRALLQGGTTPLQKPQLIITLPPGTAYEKGSSRNDQAPLPDPLVEGPNLIYRLGDLPADGTREIRFRTALGPTCPDGDLVTTARLISDTPAANQQAPEVKNTICRVRKEKWVPVPEIVLHPHFPTFGAELDDRDRHELDELVQRLSGMTIVQISVTGYTDNVRIRPRSRGVYRDNTSLSLARARSVGRYIMEKLHLPPSRLSLTGRGEEVPVASNRSEKGRALNRRVEIRILAEKAVTTNSITILADTPPSGRVLPASLSPAVPPAAREQAPPTPQPPAASEKDPPPPAKSPEEKKGIEDEEGILSPKDNAVLIYPINSVRLCLPGGLTPRLFLDGKEIPAERIGFTMKDNKSGKAIYSYIGVNFGDRGDHVLQLKGVDPFGIARFERTAKVRRSGEITAIRLKSADGNVADGKTPVRLQVELLDASGQVIPAEADLEIRGGTLKALKKESAVPDPAADPSEKVHVDVSGVALFQPVINSGPYRVTLGQGRATLEAETYVKPKLRDWILVGLGEGTVGYNAVVGHVESLHDAGQDDHLYEDGRLALYAKGKVKGEWLLTMAYDSAKGKGDTGNPSLFQTIDPNTYYTLYGDASQQQYDAASARKLYLKIERDQFYALFGDFDTGLTVTELSRYSRRLNGLKAEWQGKNFEANVFGTDTAQAYARDEIQGDGTSGLYHLSRKNIVLNSDVITIETRDRFRSEIIVSTQVLSRFIDYSIDYDAGTIFFKQPIMSRDENFNPIFIVAEYETLDAGTSALTYGGRVGAKLLDNKLKAGFTYIHEGQVNGSGNLYGLDATYKISPNTTFKGEVARTDSSFGGSAASFGGSTPNVGPAEGNAFLAELQHQTANLQGKVYFRQQDTGFGLGQQNGSEMGTRKAGGDATYKLTDTVSLTGQAYRQYNLAVGGVEDIVEGKTTYTSGPYGAHLGYRYASDTLGDGSVHTSDQLTTGVSWLTLNKRLNLHVDHDQSIGGNDNASFPTRTSFGADFKLTDKVTLFAQQEITSGAGASTNTTSAGLKATPWEGGTVNTSMGQNLDESGERIFALFGLKQVWKITDKWSVDAGLDRSQTIAKPGNYQFNVNVPPASGVATVGASQDFTAVSLGTTYKELKWSWNSRVEVRTSDLEDKWGVVASYVGEPKEGWGWSARCQLFDTKEYDGSSRVSGDLRFGMVYRPLYTKWIILDRLDLLYDRERGGTMLLSSGVTVPAGTAVVPGTMPLSADIDNRRVVNNLNANYKPDSKTQISFQYGAKYVLATIDSLDYSGYTDLIGIEGRYDISKNWDIGIRGSVLHSWSAGQFSYSAGPSVGYNIIKNAWISVGYNLIGFADRDFSAANYTAQGPFIRFRFKFDQNSVRDAIDWINHE